MEVMIDDMIDELTEYCDADDNRHCNTCKLCKKYDDEVDNLTNTLGCEWRELGDYNIRKCYKWLKEIQNEQVNENTNDVVCHPRHYNQGGIECIEALKAATVGKRGIEAVCVANVIKYLWRFEEKNGIEDCRKAAWYLDRLIKELENNA